MRIAVIFATGVLLSGCGSSLMFTVERYDLDCEPKAESGNSLAREAYERVHGRFESVHERQEALVRFGSEVSRYKDWILALNRISLALTEGEDPELRVEGAFKVITDAIAAESTLLADVAKKLGPEHKVGPVGPDIAIAWAALPAALEREAIESSADVVNSVRGELEALGGAFEVRAATAAPRLIAAARNAPDPSRFDVPGEVGEATRAIVSIAESAANAVHESRTNCQRALAEIRADGGDLIPRVHEVYQDLADPFLAYIAANPRGWRALPNSGRVSGDGDTEFILVFENGLDGRWKTVTVDPSKVISARLQVARRIVSTLATAVSGLSTSAFSVPIPTGSVVSGDSTGTADLSRMTAETALAIAVNRTRATTLEDLRTFAAGALAKLTPENAAETRQQLLRKLAPFGEDQN